MSLIYGRARRYKVLDGPFRPSLWQARNRASQARTTRLDAICGRVTAWAVLMGLGCLILWAVDRALWTAH